MRQTPWQSIAAVASVGPEPVTATFQAYSSQNPCLSCRATYCCWYLHLTDVRPQEFRDFDYLRFLLNFDAIEVLMSPKGSWGVYLRRPCQHLDADTGLCTIRGTQGHPKVCRSYDPYNCFYKKNLSEKDPKATHVRIDRHRMDAVLGHVQFDTFGHALRIPEAHEVRKLLASVPTPLGTPPAVTATGPDGPAQDDVMLRNRETSIAARDPASPCNDCSKACCRVLLFTRPAPTCFSEVDYLRYAMGFGGVMYVVWQGSHALAVRTTCRHFDSTRSLCTVYGMPERPKRCEFMNEWKCSMRETFTTRPERSIKFTDLDAFSRLEKMIRYDRNGDIKLFPSFDELRVAVGSESTVKLV